MILGSGLIQAAGWSPTWLIRDEFTDTVAAGSVDGTAATPGPGTRTAGDASSYLSVGDGAAVANSGVSSVVTDEVYLAYAAQTRAAGLCLLAKAKTTLGAGRGTIGWHSAASAGGALSAECIFLSDSVSGNRRVNGVLSLAPVSTASTYAEYAVVLRSTGALYFTDDGSEYTLQWVTDAGTTTPVYPRYQCIGTGALDQSIAHFRVTQLPAPFDTDTGLATDVHAGSVSAGTTFTHEANALVEYTLTTRPSADNADVFFRVQDASNYWISRVDSSGDISLIEVAAGTPTTRGTAAGVVSSGHRVVIIADGTTIRVYSNNTLRITYASATNFATATAGELDALGTGGVVSDLIAWPRTLSGTAASILDKASA